MARWLLWRAALRAGESEQAECGMARMARAAARVGRLEAWRGRGGHRGHASGDAVRQQPRGGRLLTAVATGAGAHARAGGGRRAGEAGPASAVGREARRRPSKPEKAFSFSN
jgi:hypothetical protein